jgi:hypothetical protein
MRLIENDYPKGKVWESKTPANLVRYMANNLYSEDQSELRTNYEKIRIGYQSASKDGYDEYKTNIRQDENNIQHMLYTRDIMSLLGVTQQEMKILEQKETQNNPQARQALAQMQDMVDMVHRLPVSEKRIIRDELLLYSTGGGLRPSDAENSKMVQNSSIVNPKIIKRMQMKVRKTADLPDDPYTQSEMFVADPEGKLGKHDSKTEKLMVYKMDIKDTDFDLQRNLSMVDKEQPYKGKTEHKTHKYKALLYGAQELAANRKSARNDQDVTESTQMAIYKGVNNQNDIELNLYSGSTDNNFGQSAVLQRFIGKMGRNNVRNMVENDYIHEESEEKDNRGARGFRTRTLGVNPRMSQMFMESTLRDPIGR